MADPQGHRLTPVQGPPSRLGHWEPLIEGQGYPGHVRQGSWRTTLDGQEPTLDRQDDRGRSPHASLPVTPLTAGLRIYRLGGEAAPVTCPPPLFLNLHLGPFQETFTK